MHILVLSGPKEAHRKQKTQNSLIRWWAGHTNLALPLRARQPEMTQKVRINQMYTKSVFKVSALQKQTSGSSGTAAGTVRLRRFLCTKFARHYYHMVFIILVSKMDQGIFLAQRVFR